MFNLYKNTYKIVINCNSLATVAVFFFVTSDHVLRGKFCVLQRLKKLDISIKMNVRVNCAEFGSHIITDLKIRSNLTQALYGWDVKTKTCQNAAPYLSPVFFVFASRQYVSELNEPQTMPNKKILLNEGYFTETIDNIELMISFLLVGFFYHSKESSAPLLTCNYRNRVIFVETFIEIILKTKKFTRPCEKELISFRWNYS